MHIRPFLPLLLAIGPGFAQGPVLLLGAPGLGLPPVADQFVDPTARSWDPAVPTPAAVRRQFVANLTGHARPDCVMLQGDKVILASAPAIHSSLDILADISGRGLSGVVDAVVVTGFGDAAALNPAHDALAYVTGNGLSIWRRDATTGDVSITEVETTGWDSVLYLAAHPVDPSAIFGIDGSGVLHVVTRGLDDPNFEHSTAFASVSGTPLGICAIDWDGNGTSDVAAVTTTGFSVYSRSGQLLASQAQTSAVAAASLALVRGGQGRPDTIAWLVPSLPTAPGSQVFSAASLRMRGFGVSNDQPLADGCTAVAAGDWSVDGIDDLVVSTWTNTHVDMLLNIWPMGPVFLYSPAASIRVALAESDTTRTGNRAPAATGDFDGDGDGDLVMAVAAGTSTAARLAYVRAQQYANVQLVPVSQVQYTEDIVNQVSYFTIHCARPPAGTHTEVLIWKETVAGDSIGEAADRVLIPVPAQATQSIVVAVERTHMAVSDGLYRILLRPVVVDPASRTVLSGIATLGILFGSPVGETRAIAAGGGNPPTGPVRIGGIVVSDGPMPPAPSGRPPVPGGAN